MWRSGKEISGKLIAKRKTRRGTLWISMFIFFIVTRLTIFEKES